MEAGPSGGILPYLGRRCFVTQGLEADQQDLGGNVIHLGLSQRGTGEGQSGQGRQGSKAFPLLL